MKRRRLVIATMKNVFNTFSRDVCDLFFVIYIRGNLDSIIRIWPVIIDMNYNNHYFASVRVWGFCDSCACVGVTIGISFPQVSK